jgi:hypothetical protein
VSEQPKPVTHGLDLRLTIGFSVGLLIGLIIGVLGTRFSSETSTRAAEAQVVAATIASAPERWFIWQGSAPIFGQPFASETECERGRKRYVTEMGAALEEQAKQYSQLSIRQAVALGVTPQELEDKAARLASAYCRAE